MLQSNVSYYSNPALAFLADEKTKDKIHRHLTDINDVISEEDIRNIETGSPEDTPATDVPGADSKEDGNNSSDIQTVWNVVDDE